MTATLRPVRRDAARLLFLIGGIALAAIVIADGSLGWRYARLLAVAAMTAVAIWEIDAWPARVRGVVAVVFGTVATAAGGGIAAIGVAKVGLTVGSAIALVLATTGVVLIVTGARLVLARRRLISQVALLVAGAAVLATAHWVTVPAVMATNVPQIESSDSTPAEYGLAYEDVTFETPDDVRLAAWYIPSQTGAAVVLMHGAGSTRGSVLAEAAVLAEHGYGALLVDARGHGESEGRAMEFGWYGERDIAGAVSYLVERGDVDAYRIGLLGMSMGAEESIGAAGMDPRVAAVVAEGATGRIAADKAWFSDEYGFAGLVTEQLEKVQYAVTDLLTAAPKPRSLRSSIARSSADFLVIAASKMPDEPKTARYLRSAAPDRVATWTVPGASHTAGLATEPDEWERRVVEFLDRTL